MATIPTAALERTRRTSTHRRSLVECASLRIGTSFRIRFTRCIPATHPFCRTRSPMATARLTAEAREAGEDRAISPIDRSTCLPRSRRTATGWAWV